MRTFCSNASNFLTCDTNDILFLAYPNLSKSKVISRVPQVYGLQIINSNYFTTLEIINVNPLPYYKE